MALSNQPLPRFVLSPQMARDPLTIMLPTAAATWIWPVGGHICAIWNGQSLRAENWLRGPCP